jgi:glutamine amidotransferase
MAKVVIVKYNAGNIRSVYCALKRLGIEAEVSDNPAILRNAQRVIFPGVGEAASAMQYLQETELDEVLTSLTQPFLGICLGMQLMCSYSEERSTSCLGMYDTQVKKFIDDGSIKIPHMGWNTIDASDDPLFSGLPADPYVYFVHSYYVAQSTETIANCTYGATTFSAALGSRNFRGVQFHPEKSGAVGAQILKNFLELKEEVLCR